jgi:hypothetical protein
MSMYRTRVVQTAQPEARASAPNSRTVAQRIPEASRTDFARIFRESYGRIGQTCLEFAEPGVAVFAFDLERDRAWVGTMCLAARAGEIRAGVVGRHAQAELFLGDDLSVALRHLVYLIEPPSLRDALRGEIRLRVLDLHTGSPPRDEQGRAVESLTAEGAVFLTCQRYALMAFVTGDLTDWPPSADDAWACLPERVFVEESLAPMASGSVPRPLPGGAPPQPGEVGRITMVRRHRGPDHVAVRALATDEPVIGQLVISSDGRKVSLPAGHESLRRGLLVGRYSRCDGGGPAVIDSESVSRVHALVIEIAGKPYAVDLASTNGTYLCRGEEESLEARVVPMGDDEIVALADSDTRMTWVAGAPGERAPFDGEAFAPPPAIRGFEISSARAPGSIDAVRAAAFLRILPRYQEASPLEKECWERHYIPFAIALAERGGAVPFAEAAPLMPPLDGRLAHIAASMNDDGLGVFDRTAAGSFALRPEILAALRALSRR